MTSTSNPKYVDFKIGQVFPTNDGGSVTILDIDNSKNITVKHNDNYGYVRKVDSKSLRKGTIKNPYFRSVYNVGFIGVGKYRRSVNRKHTKPYKRWKGMMERCYDPKYHANKPTYKECTVHPDWHNFQVFAEWFSSKIQKFPDWELDKDLLVPGNKVYGPDTCCVIPKELNRMFKETPTRKGVSLPRGVYLVESGMYNSVFGDEYLGSFETIEEASQIYEKARHSRICELYNTYCGYLSPRVNNALLNYLNKEYTNV